MGHALTNFASLAAFFAAVALGLFSHVGIRNSTAIFDGPAAQTHHAHRKRRVICKAWPCARSKIDTFNLNPAEHLV